MKCDSAAVPCWPPRLVQLCRNLGCSQNAGKQSAVIFRIAASWQSSGPSVLCIQMVCWRPCSAIYSVNAFLAFLRLLICCLFFFCVVPIFYAVPTFKRLSCCSLHGQGQVFFNCIITFKLFKKEGRGMSLFQGQATHWFSQDHCV